METWRCSIRRQFLKTDASDASEGEKGSEGVPGSDSSRLVTVLEKSIAMLERELGEKNTQISAMNDRLRESNILMKDLQSRLTLPAGKAVEAQTMDGSRPESEANPSTEGDSPKAKKSRFGWLFGE